MHCFTLHTNGFAHYACNGLSLCACVCVYVHIGMRSVEPSHTRCSQPVQTVARVRLRHLLFQQSVVYLPTQCDCAVYMPAVMSPFYRCAGPAESFHPKASTSRGLAQSTNPNVTTRCTLETTDSLSLVASSPVRRIQSVVLVIALYS